MAERSDVSPPPGRANTQANADAGPSRHDEEGEGERCCICLMPLSDRTVAGPCAHEFCFTCIGVWANQARKCPLCAAPMADHLLHDLDARQPTKFYLPPLPEKPRARSRRTPTAAEMDMWRAHTAALARRRQVYEAGTYALHVASNAHTGFRNPTPRDVALDTSPAHATPVQATTEGAATRARAFLTRELRALEIPDAPEAADEIVALLASVDVRSDAFVTLLRDRVRVDAEHLAHELCAFLRSPLGLEAYDEVVQYGDAGHPGEARREPERGRKRARSEQSGRSWSRSRSRLRSVSNDSRMRGGVRARRSHSGSRSRSRSPSPSLRRSRSPRRERRWDEADSWVDPSWAEHRSKSARRREQRANARERERRREAAKPSVNNGHTPDAGHVHAATHWAHPHDAPAHAGTHAHAHTLPGATFNRAVASAGLAIRGVAERRASLLDRLARAKAAENGGASVASVGGAGGIVGGSASGIAGVNAGDTTVPRLGTGVGDAAAEASPGNETNGSGSAEKRADELRAKLLQERRTRALREKLMARKRARVDDKGDDGEGNVGKGKGVTDKEVNEVNEVEAKAITDEVKDVTARGPTESEITGVKEIQDNSGPSIE